MGQSNNTDWPTEPSAILERAREIYNRIDGDGDIKQKANLAYQVLCCVRGYRERADENSLRANREELSGLELNCNGILVISALA